MAVQNFDQIVAFGKDNVDALVQSGTIAAKGIEELAKVYSILANQSLEQTSNAVKALSTAKSPVEFQNIYASLAKTNFDSLVTQGHKLQELTNSIVTASLAPLNARIQAVQSVFKTA